MNEAKVKAKKTSAKNVRELEVVQSDRIAMMNAANVLLTNMVAKHLGPCYSGQSWGMDKLDVSTKEQAAYDAALDFMTRQFNVGYHETDSHCKRIESETAEELEHGE